ncbi:MAG: ATP:cob(I)alamin adenosyltransferase [Bradymonadaceae bacterium]
MADDGTASDEDEPFKDPDLAINRVYTRRGDEGTTQLVGGQTVSKTSPRIVAYGTVDELNATVGTARQARIAGTSRSSARSSSASSTNSSIWAACWPLVPRTSARRCPA